MLAMPYAACEATDGGEARAFELWLEFKHTVPAPREMRSEWLCPPDNTSDVSGKGFIGK
jgi:hypothetical protein